MLAASALLFISLGQMVAGDPPSPSTTLTADQAAALDRIAADSLRGHLSFIASDLLEGRDTPSRGLDLAAEYIAAQFRRAGLEAIGDDGYYQTANWKLLEADADSFALTLKIGDDTPIQLGKDRVSMQRIRGFDLKADRVIKVDAKNLQSLTQAQVEGKAVIGEFPGVGSRDRAATFMVNGFMNRLTTLKAAVVLNVSRQPGAATGFAPGRAFDPENPRQADPSRADRPGPPLITVHDSKVLTLFESLSPGESRKVEVSSHLGEPLTRPVKVRNVAGVLRGSDPLLKDTYVLVTAHYDHIGNHGASGDTGDHLFNGANDDGSGTVSVIELATSLSTLKTRPKRSILFMTFFGEEKGLLGSRYYGRHPLVPVEKTVADVNLEQVGRTDDSEGPRIGAAVMTGHGFSEVSDIFTAAGEAEGVKVSRHPRFSDSFFARSDNQALADLGVPAHTICVAFVYPDYHGAADHWDKVDYANMAKVDRMVGHGLLMIANSPVEPRWNASNPKAARYLKAWKKRHDR
ncbi:MAG: M28 family metallopeptidase [Isosphaeraceae bacterium]